MTASPASTDPGPSTRQDIARALARRFTGWSLWHGTATGHWWALAPAWHRRQAGLIEAGGPEELAELVWRAQANERQAGSPAPGTAQGARRRRPIPRAALRPAPRPSL
ncbi:hypothetical protein [Sphaerisporangium dianthi]|uniref:Uncharacterized protein n=1 Tax=Sphaerisporangium dianthi TaxID=1436120 RepID=A0ABV9CQB7_9ACTN